MTAQLNKNAKKQTTQQSDHLTQKMSPLLIIYYSGGTLVFHIKAVISKYRLCGLSNFIIPMITF